MKKFLLALGAFGAFLVGYGASSAFAYSGTLYGRYEHHGYFTNAEDSCGAEVLGKYYRSGTEAIREDVNDADSFIQFIKNTKLDLDGNGSGDGARDKTGAAFIIHTMIGTPHTPTNQRYRPPNATQIAKWERDVRYAASRGWVTWRTNYSFTINSYWQGNGCGTDPNDAAFYDESDTMPSIVFRNSSGRIIYAIKWECGNPVGTSFAPLDDAPDFNMTGRSTVSDATPLPGDTIAFNHYVRNAGPGGTTPVGIIAGALNHPSNTIVRAGYNSGSYTAGQEKLIHTSNYTIPAGTPPNTQICQKVQYSPGSSTTSASEMGAPVCAIVQYDFDLSPMITVQVNGSSPPGSMAEEGDQITFTYAVNNSGSTESQSTSCTIYGRTVPGSYTPPASPNNTSVGYAPPGTNCPRTFPGNNTTTIITAAPETIASAPANSTICRSLFINPSEPGGGPRGVEVCVRVVARPYLKVFGGDVSAGGGIATAPDTCTNNSSAAIAAWNKRGGAGYAGAGVQYAAFALASITDFASAQNAGSSAAAPTALSFANTSTNVGSGGFGGSFGSVPCITNYYADKPASTLPLGAVIGVSSLVSGDYARSGPAVITGGNVNPGNRMDLYVDGDILITGNITYPGSWNYTSSPSFKLVVRGDIFIASTVTQLDGVYIAQADGSDGGTIYTCAVGSVLLPLGGSIYSTCNNKLTINGAFVAKNVELLRTRGTLSRSSAGEASSSNNIAEVFNYSPAAWIPQGRSGGTGDTYDAITSLPPVL